MIKTRIFFICMAFSLALFSCAGGAGGSGGGAEGTSLTIRTDNGAKTLYEKDEIVSFSVTISSGSYTASKTANKGETMMFSDIPAGTYSVKAYGKIADGSVAAKAETSVTIKSGETTNTVIRLSRIEHYTVTFQYGATATAFIPQEVSAGYPATKPTGSFDETGYEFSFWGESATATSEYDWNKPVSGPITLYAIYNVIKHTVTFDFNGGHIGGTASGDASSTVDVVEGNPPTTIPSAGEAAGAFSRPGYDFEGWATSATATSDDCISSFPNVLGDVTYYAIWSPVEYGITYTMPSGLSVTVGSGFDTYTTETEKTLPVASDLTGLPASVTFAGWYDNSSFTGTRIYSLSAGNTEDKTYYGKFTVTVYMYTEKYGDDFGSVDTIYGTTATAPSSLPDKPGYGLTGWQGGDDGEEFDFTFGSTTVTENITIWGVWEANSITYHNVGTSEIGHMASSAASTYNSGTALTLPEPVLNNFDYEFGGWYDNQDLSGAKVTSIPATASGAKEYWAKYLFGASYIDCDADEFGDIEFVSTLTSITWNVESETDLSGIVSAISSKGINVNLDLSSCSISSINAGAFSSISSYLTGITLPSGVTTIGSNAFSGCSGLTTINIPASVTLIDYGAFSGTGLTSVTGATSGWTVVPLMGSFHDDVSIGVNNLVSDNNKFTKD